MSAMLGRVINEYGPTEATVACSVYEVNRSHRQRLMDEPIAPIGVPLGSAEMSIRDSRGELVPAGFKGKIWWWRMATSMMQRRRKRDSCASPTDAAGFVRMAALLEAQQRIVFVVTHDDEYSSEADVLITMKNGQFVELRPGQPAPRSKGRSEPNSGIVHHG